LRSAGLFAAPSHPPISPSPSPSLTSPFASPASPSVSPLCPSPSPCPSPPSPSAYPLSPSPTTSPTSSPSPPFPSSRQLGNGVSNQFLPERTPLPSPNSSQSPDTSSRESPSFRKPSQVLSLFHVSEDSEAGGMVNLTKSSSFKLYHQTSTHTRGSTARSSSSWTDDVSEKSATMYQADWNIRR